MSEAELLAAILELATLRGWLTYHALPSRVRKRGVETWRTQTQGDGVGFPDLVLARWKAPCTEHERQVLYWELKVERGQLTREQSLWLALLGGRLVQPSDWTSGRVAKWLA